MSRPMIVNRFDGIDLRRLDTMPDSRTLRVGKNVDITSGRGVRNRPGTRIVTRASEYSAGLFSANGLLYAVAPSGYPSIASAQSPVLRYAFIGDGVGLDQDHITEFIGAELIGETPLGAGRPYVAIRAKDDIIEHHYINDVPTDPSQTVNTFVDLGFQASKGLIKLSGRLWAPSNVEGSVHFCTLEDPTDWQSIDPPDAGFIKVSRSVPGDRTIRSLSYFRDRLIVLFEDSMQFWVTDEQITLIGLDQVLNGPGTRQRRAVDNVLGDVFFFSQGGFRSLSTRAVAGDLAEADIGGPIRGLSETLPVDPGPVSLWSQSRAQFLTAFGNRILCFSYIPASKLAAWTEWELPFSVTDLIEADGRLYARDTEHFIHEFSNEWDTDGNDSTPVEWEVMTQFLDAGAFGRLKTFTDLSLAQQGACTVHVHPLQNDLDVSSPAAYADGVTSALTKVAIMQNAPSLALRFTGTGRWQLDGFTLGFNPLGV